MSRRAAARLELLAMDFSYGVTPGSPLAILTTLHSHGISDIGKVRALFGILDNVKEPGPEGITVANWICNNAKGPGTFRTDLRNFFKGLGEAKDWKFFASHFVTTKLDQATWSAGYVGGLIWGATGDNVVAIREILQKAPHEYPVSVPALTNIVIKDYISVIESIRVTENLQNLLDEFERQIVARSPLGGIHNTYSAIGHFIEGARRVAVDIASVPITVLETYLDKLDQLLKLLVDFLEQNKLTADLSVLLNLLKQAISYPETLFNESMDLMVDGECLKSGFIIGLSFGRVIDLAYSILRKMFEHAPQLWRFVKQVPAATRSAVIASMVALTPVDAANIAYRAEQFARSPVASQVSLAFSLDKTAAVEMARASRMVSEGSVYSRVGGVEVVSIPYLNGIRKEQNIPNFPPIDFGIEAIALGQLAIVGGRRRRVFYFAREFPEDSLKLFQARIKNFFNRTALDDMNRLPNDLKNIIGKFTREPADLTVLSRAEMLVVFQSKFKEFNLQVTKLFLASVKKSGKKYSISIDGRTYELTRWTVFNRFNQFLSSHLRTKFAGIPGIIVDEKFESVAAKLLSPNAFCLGDSSIKVVDFLRMPVIEVLMKYAPDSIAAKVFKSLLEEMKRVNPVLLREYESLSKQMLTESDNVETLNRFREVCLRLSKEAKDSIKHPFFANSMSGEDSIFDLLFGQMSPTSVVGRMRPDFAIINMVEGNLLFDFIHGRSSPAHMAKTEFYELVIRIIFGDTPKSSRLTVEETYDLKSLISTL